MAFTIELTPDLEVGLAALAKAQGLELPQFVQRVLKEQVSTGTSALTPAERAEAWLASAGGLPGTLPLTDEAMSRDSFYGPRA